MDSTHEQCKATAVGAGRCARPYSLAFRCSVAFVALRASVILRSRLFPAFDADPGLVQIVFALQTGSRERMVHYIGRCGVAIFPDRLVGFF
jgi:hypothetical protein